MILAHELVFVLGRRDVETMREASVHLDRYAVRIRKNTKSMYLNPSL